MDSMIIITTNADLFTDRARDQKTDKIVALKKVRMENEKDGKWLSVKGAWPARSKDGKKSSPNLPNEIWGFGIKRKHIFLIPF